MDIKSFKSEVWWYYNIINDLGKGENIYLNLCNGF